ncbi:MAG: hypothetical protein KDB03_10410 [Planctomycetales bacterium]|nr:hypothetical protein [Planctomycetales bacterium]
MNAQSAKSHPQDPHSRVSQPQEFQPKSKQTENFEGPHSELLATEAVVSYRPALPDFGCFLRWPDADQWIHPEDVSLAQELIPSHRVFARRTWDGEYYTLHYGECQIRVRPVMWLSVQAIDLEVGQAVELQSHFGEYDAGIYRIGDILFQPESGAIEYFLMRDAMPLPLPIARELLQPLHIDHHLRVDYYEHQIPKCHMEAADTLDVGKIEVDDEAPTES